jgi:hypothetical protein
VPIRRTEEELMAAYVCSDSHVSRVVYFAVDTDAKSFEDFLRSQLGDRVRPRDIRKATRYGWELGGNAEKEISSRITELYWTFYAQNEKEKEYGTVLCATVKGGCGRLFTAPIAEKSLLCPACSNS